MLTRLTTHSSAFSRFAAALACCIAVLFTTASTLAQAPAAHAAQATAHKGGGEANLVLPRVGTEKFMGIAGDTLLYGGLVVSLLGMVFGLAIYTNLKNLPVHKSMLEISELIYATCKSYMIQQGKFLMVRGAGADQRVPVSGLCLSRLVSERDAAE